MAAAKKKPKALDPLKDGVEVFDDVVQGSDEWHELRRGIPTASHFSKIMAEGQNGDASKQRTDYMHRLAGEIVSGQIAEAFANEAMERGRRMEPEAVEAYRQAHLVRLRRVGFVRRRLPSGRFVGCSPDALLDGDGALENKTLAPHLMIERMRAGAHKFPAEHRCQVHGTIWVCGLRYADLQLYYTGMRPLLFRVERSESLCREISDAVEVFDHELHRLVEQIRSISP
jgi:hypothetical protein